MQDVNSGRRRQVDDRGKKKRYIEKKRSKKRIKRRFVRRRLSHFFFADGKKTHYLLNSLATVVVSLTKKGSPQQFD